MGRRSAGLSFRPSVTAASTGWKESLDGQCVLPAERGRAGALKDPVRLLEVIEMLTTARAGLLDRVMSLSQEDLDRSPAGADGQSGKTCITCS